MLRKTPDKKWNFTCEKQPATGARGVVVTNAPLGSAAGAEMLAIGGNAIDAAVAALLTLTVVEPMMVGIAGGGLSHLRLADGRHLVIDAMAAAGADMRADMFTPIADDPDHYMEAKGRRNRVGPQAVSVPGNLLGWYQMQRDYGRLSFADVVEPAIRAASRGFTVSHYLNGAIAENAADLADDAEMARLMLPDGSPAPVGARMIMGDYAEALRLVQREGAAALHGGALGAAMIDRMQRGPAPSVMTLADLTAYQIREREAIFGDYRGFRVAGPPPPASSGVHVTQMLNMLEGYDMAALGFGSAEALILLAEVMRIAFEDRKAASGDPDFVSVPVDRYISKDYAQSCLARLHQVPQPGDGPWRESANTTHVTVADADGNIVTATHTINDLFGAKFIVPGTGIIPNNYMVNFDPRPGKAMSIAPGKRVPTSMAPMIVLRDGQPAFALGMPGGFRIFPSVMQAIVNLIDHKMTLQEAVEAPRLWSEGHHIELEPGFAAMAPALEAMGRDVRLVKTVGGGMNAISFDASGMMTGAACWRADGTVMAQGGGLARPGVRFVI